MTALRLDNRPAGGFFVYRPMNALRVDIFIVESKMTRVNANVKRGRNGRGIFNV